MMRSIEIDTGSLIRIVEGEAIQSNQPEIVIRQLLIDSRKLMAPTGAVFFAIQGTHHDGHIYIHDLYVKGVRFFIVEKLPDYIAELKEATIIKVRASITALQKCAAYRRTKFTIPVVGITGSNAKTIIKEWLSQTLQSDYSVIKSPRSYNSQVGVPLSVWQINERHELGIFEAGISTVNEMSTLQRVIQPTIGLFTNIGTAHAEGFQNNQQKIQEKLLLFSEADILIYCKDHKEIDAEVIRKKISSYSWSLFSDGDIVYRILSNDSFQTIISVRANHFSGEITIPFTDDASIENALHVATVLLYLKHSVQEVNKKLTALHPIGMRLELKEAINGCYVIDDSYNNDLAGLNIALDFLQNSVHKPSKSLILSDLLESGLNNEDLYRKVGESLMSANINRVFAIGESIKDLKEFYSGDCYYYKNTNEFLNDLKNINFNKEVILVKGARVFAFENIVSELQYKIHETVLEINLDAIVHNLNVYRSKLNPGTKVMAMVKAFAYGSGSFEVAQLLQYHGVDYLAVAYADEGARLRENGITLPIMVMNPSLNSFDTILRYDLEPEIYEFGLLQQLIDYAQAKNKCFRIHVKLDTGMRRLGFEEKDMTALLCQLIAFANNLKVVSVFTHLAGSDEKQHDNYTHLQLSLFDKMTDLLKESSPYPFLKHAANSSAIMRFKDSHYDMVRLGIGLYGVESAGMFQHELKPISVFKTHISQIKEIKAGDTVGYSRKGKVDKPSRIATIAVGYADGYDRRFSNGIGEVLVNGARCPVIGNVCMDMCMINVTHSNAKEGDEVIIFGESLTVSELAQKAGTISYEILTGIGERVKRVFYSE
jgi:alanine racemase